MTLRAFLYTRLSDPSKQEENYSRPAQHRLGYELAEQLGATVVRVYDEGESAETLFGRPQMMALLAAIQQGELRRGDAVIALKVNRLARNPWDLGTILRTCQFHGVEIKLVSGEMPTGEHADISLFVEGWSADKERRNFIDNAWRFLRAKAAEGKPLGFGQAPFGLRYTDERDRHGALTKARYEADPERIDSLRWMFTAYDGGMSLRQLGMALEGRGALPPYHARTGSTRWSTATIKAILSNRNYVGEGAAFDQIWITTSEGRKKLVQRQPGEEGYVALPAGVYPEVIDPDVFRRVQGRLAANQRQTVRPDRNPEVGIFRRGHAKCGLCGGPLVVKVAAGGRYHYRCNNTTERGCGKTAIGVDLLDGPAWERVLDVLTRPAAIEERLAQLQATDPTGPELAAVEDRLQEVNRKRRNLLALMEDLEDPTDRQEAKERLETLAARRREAEAERTLILARRASWEASTARVASAVDFAAQVRQEVMGESRALDWEGKRRTLFRLGAVVTLWPDGYRPRWTLTMAWDGDTRATGGAAYQGSVEFSDGWGMDWTAPEPDISRYVEIVSHSPKSFDRGIGSGGTSGRAARRAPSDRRVPGHR